MQNNRSLLIKIIILLLVACTTLFLTWNTTTHTFEKIREPVRRLSEPDPKLRLVNELFREIVQLDQLQRVQSLQESGDYKSFLEQSNGIKRKLDTLSKLSVDQPEQQRSIDSMLDLLQQRDELFIQFLNLRTAYSQNALSEQVRGILETMKAPGIKTDSSIVTIKTQLKKLVEDGDTIEQRTEKPSFWDRLLGRKKDPGRKEVQRFIREELKVQVDTLVFAQEDSMFQVLSQAIRAFDSGRIKRSNLLLSQRKQIDLAGSILVGKLLSTLSTLESQELRANQASRHWATQIIDSGLERVDRILLIFLLCIGALAVLVLIDIARSNRYRKELIAARDEAERLSAAKQRFLANISHELRTPLQSIIGFAEQLKADPAHVKPEHTQIIFKSSKHLLQVVNDALDYSRIVFGKLSINQRPFELYEVLHHVAESIEDVAGRKGLEFKLSLSNIHPGEQFSGDDFRLKQILFNLLNNAVKYTEQGGIELEASVVSHKTYVSFSATVHDTGIGISQEELPYIFNDFEQVGSHFQEGAGLGLNIVKALVDQQKGSIHVESQPGSGSSFSFTIPYTRVTKNQEDKVSEAAIAVASGVRIWLLDDDKTILNLCDLILTNHQLEHECFSDSRMLLEREIPEDLRLVFLDLRLPGMSGTEVLHSLRERIPVHQQVFIVAMTAQVFDSNAGELLGVGFDNVLTKPFLQKDFLTIVHQYAAPEINTSVEVGSDAISKSFRKEMRSDIASLRAAIEADRIEQTLLLLHRIAGRLGQMGYRDQSFAIRRMELGLRNNRVAFAALDNTLLELELFLKEVGSDMNRVEGNHNNLL